MLLIVGLPFFIKNNGGVFILYYITCVCNLNFIKLFNDVRVRELYVLETCDYKRTRPNQNFWTTTNYTHVGLYKRT